MSGVDRGALPLSRQGGDASSREIVGPETRNRDKDRRWRGHAEEGRRSHSARESSGGSSGWPALSREHDGPPDDGEDQRLDSSGTKALILPAHDRGAIASATDPLRASSRRPP